MPSFEFDPYASAASMLQGLRNGAMSSAELLENHLNRIEQVNPELNAIVTPNYGEALEVAHEADSCRSRGEDAPLLGLPLTIKDCIDVAGLVGTAGVETFAARVPDDDSRLAARVREAGGVIMGKTNVPPYAADWQSSNPVFGRTNNPGTSVGHLEAAPEVARPR